MTRIGIIIGSIRPGRKDGQVAARVQEVAVRHSDLLADLAATPGIRSGQVVEPEQVPSLVAYLASPLAASTTGQEYLFDGGAIQTA